MAEFYPLLFGRGFSLSQLLFFCCFSSPLCRAPVPARRAGDASHRLGGGLRPPPIKQRFLRRYFSFSGYSPSAVSAAMAAATFSWSSR